MSQAKRSFDATLAARIPGVASLARLFGRIASLRWGPVPIGLVALLPIAILIDAFDAGDEFVGGPIGMGLSFLLEAAFLLGLTGRASYAVGLAGLDIIPIVDVIPWATITLVMEISRAWGERCAPESPERPQGPIIDV